MEKKYKLFPAMEEEYRFRRTVRGGLCYVYPAIPSLGYIAALYRSGRLLP